MEISDWMQGWTVRQVLLARPPTISGGRRGPWEIMVGKVGRQQWLVTVARHREDTDMEKQEQARQRFLGWYVITDERQDTVPTERVRRDWWLAHQDVGLNVATARRRDGVQALIDAGATRGRGVLRGVVLADDLWDQAMGVLADAGFSE